ncbi:hypothetical protein F5Y14DRAFT_464161 [Nemania sp. NC0429]|nr:hypothetical protein F5Y14DRAFT_464161 [Nemania sp. NC0429]
MSNFPSTMIRFPLQWTNLSDLISLLTGAGRDTVQKALAQTTGCLCYIPVYFSLGRIAYSSIALVGAIRDGRLLRSPGNAIKVFNLESGHRHDDRNWVAGRIFRDLEADVSREDPMPYNGIRISIWEAVEDPNRRTKHWYNKTRILRVPIAILQLVVAPIPLILYGDRGIPLFTTASTLLEMIMGSLPQWRAEKPPKRQHSKAIFGLTPGNGSKDIAIIIGGGHWLDSEELRLQEAPRTEKPWEKFTRAGLGSWVTLCIGVVQVTSAALVENTRFLVPVSVIGMFHNTYLAATERRPKHLDLHLRHVETMMSVKVMDGLMDLEVGYGCARPLVSEFFPGPLKEDEVAWWNGDRKRYDATRSLYFWDLQYFADDTNVSKFSQLIWGEVNT